MDVERAEVGIVGAGPIGLELAVALKKRGIDYLHFDAKQVGYTISWFAPQTKFFSSNERIAIAGVPLETPDQAKATREQYLAYLRGIVRQFDLQVRTYEPIVGIDRPAGEFVLTTNPRGGKRSYRVNKLVLATGGTDHPRKLNVPGEDLPHVSAYFRDPHEYFDRTLLIIGGKNSAVEAALRSHYAGARVAMSYRREKLPEKSIKYWLLPEINNLIDTGRIAGHFTTQPVAITPTHVTLRRLGASAGDGSTFDVPADFVLKLIGYEQDTTLFKLAGVKILGDCGAPAYDDRTMETNIENLYVAGTAVGGTQDKYTVFIENCHVHVERIVAALTGAAPPPAPAPLARPES